MHKHKWQTLAILPIEICDPMGYNIITVRKELTSMKERRMAMANKKRKSTKPVHKSYIISGLVDLLVGTLLILIGKLVD